MTNLKFTDGVEFNTSGVLRVEERFDRWYVVGEGRLVPVRDRNDGEEYIKNFYHIEHIED